VTSTSAPYKDGYGDAPTIDEALADYDAWLHHRAHQMLPPTDHRHDDLVQEGRIAMWEALARHDPGKGALPAWLTKNAAWRMNTVLSRRDGWTGRPMEAQPSGVRTSKGDEARTRISEAIAAHQHETGSQPSVREIGKRTGLSVSTVHHHMKRLHVTPVQDVTVVALDDESAAEIVTPDVAEAAMLAYHQGEIAEALAGLTEAQRRYVRLRFWESASGTDLRDAFGYDPKGLWSSPKSPAARERLAKSLAHLNAA